MRWSRTVQVVSGVGREGDAGVRVGVDPGDMGVRRRERGEGAAGHGGPYFERVGGGVPINAHLDFYAGHRVNVPVGSSGERLYGVYASEVFSPFSSTVWPMLLTSATVASRKAVTGSSPSMTVTCGGGSDEGGGLAGQLLGVAAVVGEADPHLDSVALVGLYQGVGGVRRPCDVGVGRPVVANPLVAELVQLGVAQAVGVGDGRRYPPSAFRPRRRRR